MKIGTKSILFGAHCFFIHPWFVAWAWWKLYGFPFDPRLWVAFIVHDLGYWGKPNMDGEEGEMHPIWGAMVMHYLFERVKCHRTTLRDLIPGIGRECGNVDLWNYLDGELHHKAMGFWFRFTYFHSRFLSKKHKAHYSPLCVADKLAIALEPWWLYLPRVKWTGEVEEYMSLAEERNLGGKYGGKYATMQLDLSSKRAWHRHVADYCEKWAYEHKNGRRDKWTPEHNEK